MGSAVKGGQAWVVDGVDGSDGLLHTWARPKQAAERQVERKRGPTVGMRGSVRAKRGSCRRGGTRVQKSTSGQGRNTELMPVPNRPLNPACHAVRA